MQASSVNGSFAPSRMMGAMTRSTLAASMTRPSAAGRDDVRVDEQWLDGRDRRGPGDVEADQLRSADHRRLDDGDVEPLSIVPAAAHVTDRDDAIAAHVGLERGVLPDVPEALHGDRHVTTLRGPRATDMVEHRLERDDGAPPRRDRATQRPARARRACP